MRGKEGLAAHRARLNAAHEHIDRLTDELVEAKLRARRYEAAALRVPGLDAEVARLRVQTDEGTSDKLERQREAHERRELVLEDRLARLSEVLNDIGERNDNVFSPNNIAELDKCLGTAWREPASMPRDFRRARVKSGADFVRKASPEQLRDAGVRKFGHLVRVVDPAKACVQGLAPPPAAEER